MRVKVIQHGFWIHQRSPGEIMDIPDRLFSKTWMKRLDEELVPAPVEAAGAVPAASEETKILQPQERRGPGRPRKS